MHLATHALASWMVANSAPIPRRDRAIVTVAGIAPDLDAFGAVVDFATGGRTMWWDDYHHVLGHNLMLAVAATAAAWFLAARRRVTAALAFLACHLHFLLDHVGARGPDGHGWPVAYFYPFSARTIPPPSWQWELNAWPNIVLTAILLVATLYLAWRRGRSPVEMVSRRWDRVFVETLRARFGTQGPSAR